MKIKRKIKNLMLKMVIKLKQKICEHEGYKEMVDNSPLQCISGQTVYIVCSRCEKIKSSYFKKY